MDLGGWLYATAFTNRTRSFLWLVGEIARPTFRTGQAQKPYPPYWMFRRSGRLLAVRAPGLTNRTIWLVAGVARPTFRTGQAQKPYPLYWRFRHPLPPGRCVQALRQRWWLPPLPLLHRTSVL